jgi:hypothetical protein
LRPPTLAEGQHEAEQVVKKFIAMEEEMNATKELAAQVRMLMSSAYSTIAFG